MHRDQQQGAGKVIRLTDETVGLRYDNNQRRVAYGLLHHVVEAWEQMVDVTKLGPSPAPTDEAMSP